MIDIDSKHWIWFPVGATVLDRLITVPFFGLEANAVVTELGIVPWMILTLFLVGSMLFTWFHWGLWTESIARVAVILLGVFTLLITAMNVLVVMGVLPTT